jgi:hypothetical protein
MPMKNLINYQEVSKDNSFKLALRIVRKIWNPTKNSKSCTYDPPRWNVYASERKSPEAAMTSIRQLLSSCISSYPYRGTLGPNSE